MDDKVRETQLNTFLHYTFAEVGYVEVGGIRESIYVRRWARWGV